MHTDRQYQSTFNQSFNTSKDRSSYQNATMQNNRTLPTTSRTLRVHSLSGTQSFQRGDLGKHTLRQAGMTTIFKGIRENDVQKITGNKNMTLLPTIRRGSFVNNQDDKSNVKGNIHKNLIDNRKKHDQLKDQVKRMQTELEQLREANDMLKKREEDMQNQMINVKVSSAYENDMQMAKGLYENSYWAYKSYQHMKRRLKDDQVSYEIKQNEINESLRLVDFDIRQADVTAMKSQQFNHQTQLVMESMFQKIEEDQEVREKELDQFKEVHRKKQEIERANEERLMKQKYISEHAIHDKDGQEKKWRGLLRVHQFVNHMFKAKMDRELKKFEVVESAYQNIKQATGISDTQEILEKFLTREQTYGELLASIAEFESKIELLNTRKDDGNQRIEDLRQELIELEQNKKGKSFASLDHNLNKKLENVDDQQNRVELEKERIYQWCIKTLTQIHKINQEKEKKKQQEEKEAEQERQRQLEQEKLEKKQLEEQQQQEQDLTPTPNQQQQQQEEEQEQQNQDEEQQQQEQEDTKQLSKKIQIERINYFEQYPREKFTELFNECMNQLNNIMEGQNQEEISQIQEQMYKARPEDETHQDDFYARNTRILPPTRKKSINKYSSNINQSGEDIEQQLINEIQRVKAENGETYIDKNKDSNNTSHNNSYINETETNDNTNDENAFRDEQEEQDYIAMMREDILREQELAKQKRKYEEELRKKQEKAKLLF